MNIWKIHEHVISYTSLDMWSDSYIWLSKVAKGIFGATFIVAIWIKFILGGGFLLPFQFHLKFLRWLQCESCPSTYLKEDSDRRPKGKHCKDPQAVQASVHSNIYGEPLALHKGYKATSSGTRKRGKQNDTKIYKTSPNRKGLAQARGALSRTQ